jgi:protein-tyrosine phosphatase
MPESMPLADTHVHLLAGLDDGPRDTDEALALCRQLVAEGVRTATALAHQNDMFPDNTPQKITEATAALVKLLAERKIPLGVCPTGEVVLSDNLVTRWTNGELQSVGGAKKYLLVEMPHRAFLDPRPAATALRQLGVRMIVAHAERYEPMLHDPGFTEQCIAAGCLIQVTTDAFTMASDRELAALREWGTRGMIHLLGSDGHRIDYRRPQWKDGFRIFQRLVGAPAAEKVASIWGSAVLQGLNVNPPAPKPKQKTWFGKMFGL